MHFSRKFSGLLVFLVIAGAVATSSVSNAAGRKVYLVNGIASTLLGYGLTNLKKKIPYARHFKYTTTAATGTIKRGIINDAIKAYNADQSVKISLVGISYGARMVTEIASTLYSKGVPVHYMAVIEGKNLSSIKGNVRKADNVTCTGGTCARIRARLASGNRSTRLGDLVVNTGHVASSDSPRVHSRIISQINSN